MAKNLMKSVKSGAKDVATGAVIGLFAGAVAFGLKSVSPRIPYVGKYIDEYL